MPARSSLIWSIPFSCRFPPAPFTVSETALAAVAAVSWMVVWTSPAVCVRWEAASWGALAQPRACRIVYLRERKITVKLKSCLDCEASIPHHTQVSPRGQYPL
jgi:hypothetical protein